MSQILLGPFKRREWGLTPCFVRHSLFTNGFLPLVIWAGFVLLLSGVLGVPCWENDCEINRDIIREVIPVAVSTVDGLNGSQWVKWLILYWPLWEICKCTLHIICSEKLIVHNIIIQNVKKNPKIYDSGMFCYVDNLQEAKYRIANCCTHWDNFKH